MLNYAGDLQEKKITTTGGSYGLTVGGTYQFNGHILANLNLTYGQVGASDANNGPKYFYRNLNFKSNIFETAVTLEGDLFDIRSSTSGDYSNSDAGFTRITPYAFVGLGIFNFDPYTTYNGQKVYLPPLKTEAEAEPYSLWKPVFPFGIGLKYAVSDDIVIAGEIDYRKTTTDYLDDVSTYHFVDTTTFTNPLARTLSYRADEIAGTKYPFYGQRGNPKKKDNYYAFMIKVTFTFGEGTSLFKYGYGN